MTSMNTKSTLGNRAGRKGFLVVKLLDQFPQSNKQKQMLLGDLGMLIVQILFDSLRCGSFCLPLSFCLIKTCFWIC